MALTRAELQVPVFQHESGVDLSLVLIPPKGGTTNTTNAIHAKMDSQNHPANQGPTQAMTSNAFFFLAQTYEQTEYGMAYAMVAGLILLGMLAICIPRPRKQELFDSDETKAKKKKKKKKKVKS